MQRGADHPSELFHDILDVVAQIKHQLQRQSVLSKQELVPVGEKDINSMVMLIEKSEPTSLQG